MPARHDFNQYLQNNSWLAVILAMQRLDQFIDLLKIDATSIFAANALTELCSPPYKFRRPGFSAFFAGTFCLPIFLYSFLFPRYGKKLLSDDLFPQADVNFYDYILKIFYIHLLSVCHNKIILTNEKEEL